MTPVNRHYSKTGGGIETLFHFKRVDHVRLFNVLAQNLIPTLTSLTTQNFYMGKLENFLTCLNLSSYIKGKILNDDGAEFFTKISLEAIYKSLYGNASIADIFLLIDEIPKILSMPYPAAEKIRETLIEVISKIMLTYRMNNYWSGWADLNDKLNMLKSFGDVKKI